MCSRQSHGCPEKTAILLHSLKMIRRFIMIYGSQILHPRCKVLVGISKLLQGGMGVEHPSDMCRDRDKQIKQFPVFRASRPPSDGQVPHGFSQMKHRDHDLASNVRIKGDTIPLSMNIFQPDRTLPGADFPEGSRCQRQFHT